MKHYSTKMGPICLSEEKSMAPYIKAVTCPNCKALLSHLKSILGKLMAENVHYQDTLAAIKILETCVAPLFLIEIYQNFQSEFKAIAEENYEDAKADFWKAIQDQFGCDVFIPDYLTKQKEFNENTKNAHEKYMDALEYFSGPNSWKMYLNEKFREMIRT